MIPLLGISPSSLSQLVVDDEGRWAISGADDGEVTVLAGQAFVGAFPLFEMPFPEFKRRLEQAIRNTGAPVEADTFPAAALVKFALESTASTYWKDFAFTWAEQLVGPGSDLLPVLDAIARGNWPESFRKQARRIRALVPKESS